VSTATGTPLAYLERFAEAGGPVERILLLALPLVIGRSETAGHTIYSSKVSREHASIVLVNNAFAVRDLGSTNGTYVNGQRITEHRLQDGDIIHIAHVEFAFHRPEAIVRDPVATTDVDVELTQLLRADRPESVIRGTRLLQELIADRACEILYQPIVRLGDRSVVAYEALCRGRHPELSRDPVTLLRLAEQCGVVIELCQMLAQMAVTGSHKLPRGAKLFVNLHAQEIVSPGLADSLAVLRALSSDDHPVVLEIPETSVTDLATMLETRRIFGSLGFEFAYDDFGAGQGHLMELTELPPDYLKIDKSMIDGIESAKSRQDMVGALIQVMKGLGVRVIAEGIETEPVAAICLALGCDFGQGYLFGRPA